MPNVVSTGHSVLARQTHGHVPFFLGLAWAPRSQSLGYLILRTRPDRRLEMCMQTSETYGAVNEMGTKKSGCDVDLTRLKTTSMD